VPCQYHSHAGLKAKVKKGRNGLRVGVRVTEDDVGSDQCKPCGSRQEGANRSFRRSSRR